MSFQLIENPAKCSIGAVIVAEVLRTDKKISIDITWSESKASRGVQLIDKDGTVVGGTSNDVGRYLARVTGSSLYGGNEALERTEVDHWLSFAIGPLKCSKSVAEALAYLDRSLAPKTWLVAKQMTIADLLVFSTIYSQSLLDSNTNYPHLVRWYKMISSLPAVKRALEEIRKNAKPGSLKREGSAENGTNPKSAKSSKEQGKFIDLPGAEMGKIVVRFPPEASGYLHIGHAKAALLNQYYADAFQGQLIMRFDDTNPAKESVEFEDAILEDLKMLEIKPDRFTHTSQYFDLMLTYCEKMITDGKAYVDDTTAEVMKEQRDQRLPSANRDNTVEKNLQLWKEMKEGTKRGTECCVRAKIDYASVNGCMRDPTIYRCKPEPHPRTGTQYKVYPTYDFACPIVDAIEGVTHTLRTTEYHDRDAQFYWLIEALGLRRPYIWEYSRLNMTNTVLSKRKLTWFVAEGLVDGWDDPRFPTVRGILRRGMTVEGLKQFIIAQGSSRAVVFMEWDKIWSFNRKVIEGTAFRYMALTEDSTVPVHIKGASEGWLTVQNHPKDPSLGTKQVRIGQNVLLEREDVPLLTEGKNATFINWGNIMIKKINSENGEVTEIEAELNLDNKDYKTTPKLSWLCREKSADDLIPCYGVYFNHIITKPVLEKDDDFKNYVAKDTRKEVKLVGECELKRVAKGDIIQLQRKGFFRCDVPYAPASANSSREQPLILFHIPDGHTKNPTTSAAFPTPANTKQSAKQSEVKTDGQDVNQLNNKVAEQGEKVRLLKAAKADKTTIDQEVKVLLALKAEYKSKTGADWKPGAVAPATTTQPKGSDKSADTINSQIVKQGDKVRELKSAKADKSLVDEAVKILLNLKADYKSATGKDWKLGVVAAPAAAAKPEANVSGADAINEQIAKQGDKVRELKGAKADKSVIDQEVKTLLNLKTQYKAATGKDWKPGTVAAPAAVAKPEANVSGADAINEQIAKQGDKVRELKGAKADKSVIDQEVKTLLSLKAQYKAATGKDWKPGTVAAPAAVAKPEANVSGADAINEHIAKQGDKVRELKGAKAEKSVIDQEVKTLLSLKAQYKAATGKDWKPNTMATQPASKPAMKDDSADKLNEQIAKQGDKVRELKSAKAEKSVIDAEVKILLNLKAEYKTSTGQEWKPVSTGAPTAPPRKAGKEAKKAAKPSVIASAASAVKEATKTGTRLCLEAKKNESLSDWYSQVITKGEMIEYYDVSGCYILRPWSYSIWEVIKDWFDAEIKKLGVQNCYFPIFVSGSVLEREKNHIADFAPEVAWVTKSGDSDLAEPIAIRPTSETVMYPAYAKWLKSHRDLPLRLNQWNNVVRWEFKHPQPFLRTREFLWQEGHTAFATKAEAEEEVLQILELYAKVYEDLMAIPVVRGRKTEKEKFAGGDYTTTVEAFVSASGRAIQGATSHYLGQNFSKMFDIQVTGAEESGEKLFVYQNSWGITTRTIGVMIMVHGDDVGLVLPPKVACVQAIIVPCGITATSTADQRQHLSAECIKLENELKDSGKIRVKGDYRDNYSPGWKFNHWELKGVPLRIELGPKDLQKEQVTLVRRDNSERITIPRVQATTEVNRVLNEIQQSMFARASEELKQHIVQTEDWNTFCKELDKKNLLLSPFCGEIPCEDQIKAESAREEAGAEPGAPAMGAKSLCIPFDQPKLTTPLAKQRCIHPKCANSPKFYTLFGRSY